MMLKMTLHCRHHAHPHYYPRLPHQTERPERFHTICPHDVFDVLTIFLSHSPDISADIDILV